MAKARNLAGLAALGALGYMMARGGKQDGSNVPVEDRGTSASRTSARAEPTIAELARGSRDLEGGITPTGLNEYGEKYTLEGSAAPTRTAPARAASEAKRAAPSAAPRRNVAGDYTRKMGATAEEIAAYRNRAAPAPARAAAQDNRPDLSTPEGRAAAERAQALERVTPEEMLIGGPGLKTLHAAAKRLAAPRLAEYTQPLLAAPVPRLPAPGMKKGGAVRAKTSTVKMASGGSVSSASKRADGIAQRGKTKGRIC